MKQGCNGKTKEFSYDNQMATEFGVAGLMAEVAQFTFIKSILNIK